MASPLMPAAFIGHGSPMNTLESNRFTKAWRQLGASLPRPRAVLAISAHWFIPSTAVTAMPKPPVIHDFFGFPPALFAFDYPAPGAPEVAKEVADLVQPGFVGLDQDSWGIDHGTWSVLAHVFPRADIPVLQLSVHSAQPIEYHFELGAKLAPLRERGVFILASGNVVHNLRRIDFHRPDLAYDWGQRFDAEVEEIMATRPQRLGDAQRLADYSASVPTPEHFLPLAYIAGLAAAAGEPARSFAQGGTLGSITMTSYLVGGTPPQDDVRTAAAGLPDPRQTPPEQTNT